MSERVAVVDVRGVEVFHWNPRRPLLRGRPGKFLPKRGLVNNFGDMIGPELVRSLAGPGPRASHDTRLLAVGSILHFARNGDVVWGSGVNGKVPLEQIVAGAIDVRAVRGPLTAEVLKARGLEVPDIFGDPALLLPELLGITRNAAPSRRFVVIPNLHDERFWRRHPESISPRLPFETVVRIIADAEQVIASSLHGLVIADALGVPAAMLRPSQESLFKYEDYYEGTGRKLPRVSENLGDALEHPAPTLTSSSDALRESFPSNLWPAS